MPRKKVNQTKYRYHMERRIDNERDRLNELADRLVEFGAPASAVDAVNKAVRNLDRADAALR